MCLQSIKGDYAWKKLVLYVSPPNFRTSLVRRILKSVYPFVQIWELDSKEFNP